METSKPNAGAATNLTLDPDTACSCLILSDENTTATNGPVQTYPDKPERFDPCPQVLCKEPLNKRQYFEVEWSTGERNIVGIGLAYKSIARKGARNITGFGFNGVSWYFGINKNTLVAWHDSKNSMFPVPAGGCSRVGVYLDWAGGSLSFYNVSSSTLTHLYTFQAKFSEPLYLGFFLGNNTNHATVHSV